MTAMMLDVRQPTDGELARRASGGDRDAFAALVERHYDFIFRMAYRLIGRRADAEDMAQEVCVKLGRAIASYRAGSAFTTWLYAIVLNVARDAMRKSAREARKAAAFGLHTLTEGTATEMPDDPVEALWEAVRQLPDKQREAVTLVYGEGLSHAEAADVMAVAEPTVSWHIHEAKKRLKAHLRPAGEV